MALNNLFRQSCVTPACRSVSTRRQVLTLVAMATRFRVFLGLSKNLYPLPIKNYL